MATRRESTVVWAPSADRDLGRIQGFLQPRSPAAFRGLARRLLAATNRLALFPESGLADPAVSTDGRYRYVVVSPYRLYYSAEEGTARILRVWDSRRSPEEFRVGDAAEGDEQATAESGASTRGGIDQGGSG